MSTEIIKILDYICQKIGLVVDWSSITLTEQVIPMIYEFTNRYALFNLAIAACMFVGMLVCMCVLSWICKEFNKENPLFKDYDSEPTGVLIAMFISFGFITLVCFIGVLIYFGDFLMWKITPEIGIWQLLNN